MLSAFRHTDMPYRANKIFWQLGLWPVCGLYRLQSVATVDNLVV